MIKFSKFMGSGLLLLGYCSSSIWAADFVLITNPSVSVTAITLDNLSDIYLLRTIVWDDGRRIVPVNRESGSNTRTLFSTRILRQRQDSLSNYWDKMRFKGMTPPLIQESDQAVLAFVQKVPGAIGYVRTSTELKGVKVLKIQDESQ
jgi:ABC-type phosphate transport system substrate-binding protein